MLSRWAVRYWRDTQNPSQPVRDVLSQPNHFLGDIARQLSSAVRLPEKEPSLKVLFFQLQWRVPLRHRNTVTVWPTDDSFPETSEDFQVLGPVLDPGIKYRTDQRILANVGVKVT